MTLDEFIVSPRRNAWVRHGVFNIYVRHSVRAIEEKVQVTLDIANIQSDTPGSGTFWQMIEHVKEKTDAIIYVENVANEKLAASFRKKGWKETADWSPSFYL